MDPAALGTTHIGLEAIRRRETLDDSESRDAARRRHRTATRRGLRVAIARSLRSVANAIDTQPAQPALG